KAAAALAAPKHAPARLRDRLQCPDSRSGPLLQDEGRIAIEDVIGPIDRRQSMYGLAAARDRVAQSGAGEQALVEAAREGGGRGIADRPIGPDIVRDPSAQECL